MSATSDGPREKERAACKALPLRERFERVTSEDASFLDDMLAKLTNGAVAAFCDYDFTVLKDARVISEWVEEEAEEWGMMRLEPASVDVWTVDAHGRERLFEVSAELVVEADSEEVVP